MLLPHLIYVLLTYLLYVLLTYLLYVLLTYLLYVMPTYLLYVLLPRLVYVLLLPCLLVDADLLARIHSSRLQLLFTQILADVHRDQRTIYLLSRLRAIDS